MATPTAQQALDLMYRASTTGVSNAELAQFGGYAAVKAAAQAASFDATPTFIQSYEQSNALPASASTIANQQFIGAGGQERFQQQEADLMSSNAALAAATRQRVADEFAAAEQQAAAAARISAQQQAAEAARVLAAQQAATTTGTGIPGAPVASGGTIRTGTTTAGTTGMTIKQAYQQVLGRTPSQQEIDYWTTQFGDSVDATELSTFSVAAQPERAAAPTTNNAIRQMYLSVLGREPDAAGLKYFSDLFGADVNAAELGAFRGMATQEINANAARNAGTTAGATAGAINRPTTPTQVTGTQLAPAQVTNTAITGTPFTNLYTPATVQQNAPRLSDIQAAAQSANPYQSLMSLTPQRTLSPAYAAQAGQTTANTNLGGYDTSLYSQPLTGLLAPSTVAGGGGTDLVNNSGDQRGPGTNNTASNIDPLAVGMARVANLFSSPISLTRAPVIDAAFNLTDAGRLAAANAATIAGFGVDAGDADVGSARGDSSNDGGGGARAGGGATGGGYMAKGGMVTPRQVKGPNPPGPDDGYTGLDIGEYVIRKSAVKKYGSNIFEQINAGKIPAQRLKSLLE